MNSTELRERLRDGERHAPDPAEVLRTVTAMRRGRWRRLRFLQVAAVVVAVAVVATATTLVIRGTSPDEAPSNVGPTSGPVVTAAQLDSYRWSQLPPAPIAGRSGAATVWTGSEMLVWGGQNAKGDKDYADGAAYDPATRTWRALAPSPLSARMPITWVWTGAELFVWGGEKGQHDGALYDPATDSWTKVPALPSSVPSARGLITAVIGPETGVSASRTAPVTTTMSPPVEPIEATAVWTGTAVRLLAFREQSRTIATWTYQSGQNSWVPGPSLTPADNAQLGGIQAVNTAETTYLWVAWSTSPDRTGAIHDYVDGYRLTGDSWQRIDYRPALSSLGYVVPAGDEFLMSPAQLYEGFHSGPMAIVPGRRIDPVTGSATELPKPAGDYAMDSYQVVWTGAALLGYGSGSYSQSADGPPHPPGAAAAWDQTSNRWRMLTPSPLAFGNTATGVWTGSELLVWGLMASPDQVFNGQSDYRSAGLQFAPPVAATTAPTAPSPGTAETEAMQPTRAGSVRMSAPSTASTAAGSTASGGQDASAGADTGAGMAIDTGAADGAITGQLGGAGVGSASGAVTAADLATYRWSELPKAPIAGRNGAATVWTGSEMVIWGGRPDLSLKDFDDGAAYNPATRRWRILSPSPLDARVPTTWVWTGSQLFVWGGEKGQVDGALYDPSTDSWRRTPTVPKVAAGSDATAVWTGHEIELLVWNHGNPSVTAWAYQPGDDGWTARGVITPRQDAVIYRAAAASVDSVTYAWAAWSFSTPPTTRTDGAIEISSSTAVSGYALAGSRWRSVDTASSLGALGTVTAAGHQVISGPTTAAWGPSLGPAEMAPGQRIDPVTGDIAALPELNGRDAFDNYQVVWTGSVLLGYGVTTWQNSAEYPAGSTAAWQPGSDRWQSLSRAPLVILDGVTGVWTGTEFLAWGQMYPPDRAVNDTQDYRTAGLQFAPPETGSG